MLKNTGLNSIIYSAGLKISCMLFSSAYLFLKASYSQEIQPVDELDLKDAGKKIENTIIIYTSKANLENVHNTTLGDKEIKATALIINRDTIVPEKIDTRGQTTLSFRRKSFSFSLKSKASFTHGEKKESFKRFFALNLAMDKNYANNRMAFEMMEEIDLFHLFYSFCEMRINNQSEGIYMIIERPEDWAIKRENSPLMLRRGYNEQIIKTETGKKITREEEKKYNSLYSKIYISLDRYKGEELYSSLSEKIDLDTYMKWLAFNFIVRNSDYTDEVYFYIDKRINKFSIIPWDYDDLFSREPHEGNIESRMILGDRLIFSAEDQLDQKIADDGFLYQKYLGHFKEILEKLSPSVLKRIFENTYSELYPYYSSEEIISMSKYDYYLATNLQKLKDEMIVLYRQLVISRELYLKNIKNQI